MALKGLVQAVRSFLAREAKPTEPTLREDARIYEIGGVWGAAINWWRFAPEKDTFKVVGWLYRIPMVGDELRSVMKSGRTARFVFVSVEPQRDPPDMFFAEVRPLGYLEEPRTSNGE